MAIKHIAGKESPFVTGKGIDHADRDGTTVEVSGRYTDLERIVPKKGDSCEFLPDGCIVNTANLRSDGDGMGTLTITSVAYGESSINTFPETTTWSVDMVEVQQDLQAHPVILKNPKARGEVILWLATDESKRYNPEGTPYNANIKDEMFRYAPSGHVGEIAVEDMKHVEQKEAVDFCQAYIDGIKTFNVYLPVVNRISVYKRLPGASMNGASTTGGTAKFSSTIGRFDVPDLHLQGYGVREGRWFKSRDSYEQQGDTTWRRTEQWTFTPGEKHTWIYEEAN